ncbi:uncharacterized protein LOC123565422 [Mercenaria mercenaria]|uniref:uncharacterized protein LOC123565422 n=1 Tax=Mercenaria mercenaria TaxID=6596 RepID=UPI00234EE86C|nr:uncharacterized protein LOC123565422 [Mercenaria mercenaria]
MLIMETPTKESVMVKLTPTSKKFKCILCGEMKENRKERQRLFHGEEKTDLWYIIERLLGINISEDDHSEICCRNCAKKLYNTDKSLRMTKETYDKSRNELIQSHGVKKFKRLSMDSSHNTKRKALFSTEGSSEVETASTNTEDDDAYGQCLGASARTEFSDLIEALQDGDLDRSLEYLQKNETLCNGMSDMLFENLKLEIQGLCSKEGNSVLRDSDKTSLLDFSFSKIADEWKERAPTFYKFLKYSSTNIRSEKRNKVKKSENLLYGQISAGSKLLHLYNMNMKAMQVINDIVLLKGGIKKSGFCQITSHE